ncbi:hypothetical protein [Ramlibacter humi]|uniref:Uncharacterized protein n=1 Tax=Ramlibacter humi TaxID=2530451 RepID=A0A4Z0C8V8_9BURK|nr:hypothetical protein [Ramlibacter humi]TFZ08117.1 hypothetical protein EZ216_02830 [Ramlibacter humi]
MRLLLAVALSALACTAHAEDPLKSAECGAALEALQAARADGDATRVEAVRSQAARACLGGNGDAQRPSPAAQPPIAVAPPVIVPREPRRAPVAPPPPATVTIERPTVLTHCDPGGCWDSDGRRLNRAGAVLMGPRGACATAGATVHCP